MPHQLNGHVYFQTDELVRGCNLYIVRAIFRNIHNDQNGNVCENRRLEKDSNIEYSNCGWDFLK